MRKLLVIVLTIIGIGLLIHGIAILLNETRSYWLF